MRPLALLIAANACDGARREVMAVVAAHSAETRCRPSTYLHNVPHDGFRVRCFRIAPE
jgi:hypothetical protein